MTRHAAPARTILSLSALAVGGLITGGLLFAGPLNPPVGPVASTYKTLSEVEPRIAINATNTPGDANSLFKITQPGSYYLSGNITGVAGKHGIEITTSGVTLDLMGFDLVGIPGMGLFDGVTATALDLTNIAVVNGSLRNWGNHGLDLLSFGSFGCRVEGVRASGNAGPGISAGLGSTVINCTASRNTGDGIQTNSGCTVSHCAARSNLGDGINSLGESTITACTATFNQGDGIDAFRNSAVSGCMSGVNTLNGIRVGPNSRVADNTCVSNGAGPGLFSGIFTDSDSVRIEGNHVADNDFGIGAAGTGHFIVRNYAGGNTNNYSLPAGGSFIGTIVGTNAAMNSAANANVNISN